MLALRGRDDICDAWTEKAICNIKTNLLEQVVSLILLYVKNITMENPTMNPLIELQAFGQSVWYDDIHRDLICSGALKALIDNDGLLGMTSNPSIFEKAIRTGHDYDDLFREVSARPVGLKEIYETLAIRDIQDAADLFYPVYEKTHKKDGYVSLEVSPDLAYDTEGTIKEALRLFKAVGRKNIMIKVPGTKEGVPAIERLIYEGLNINVTLLFSVERYEEVALAYIAGLERRVNAGQDISSIASVASFFISRIDTEVDARLEAKRKTADPNLAEQCQAVMGKVAIANAKMAYVKFAEIVQSAPFVKLQKHGASAQRLLWASTSTKNKAYPALYYAEELIGKDTVNTLPVATFDDFRDHGKVANRLDTGIEDAKKILKKAGDCGIHLQDVTKKLSDDGVALFANAFDQLMATLHDRRKKQRGWDTSILSFALGKWSLQVANAETKIKQDRVLPRLLRKDPKVWHSNPPADMPIFLSWLSIIEEELETVDYVNAFVDGIRQQFKHVVLIGIGGSSMAPKALRAIFGKRPGFPDLYVLDTILPESIAALEKQIKLEETLFIVASKSGSTIEPMTACYYFLQQVTRMKGERAGEHFIAITDPGSPFELYAKENRFREIFHGVSDIGGRYSALSHFGMVPAAIMGIDIRKMLLEAQTMRLRTDPYIPCEENPCAWLGAAIGQLAKEGKDKLTFITSPTLQPFEFWLEQLIAESTGKQGLGIVPIVEMAPPSLSSPAYGGGLGRGQEGLEDRVFVYIRYSHDANKNEDTAVAALKAAGLPVIQIRIDDKIEIGGQFFLWSMATAVAGAILNVNPFDQPDVESSKKITRVLLEKADQGIVAQKETPVVIEDGITLYANPTVAGNSLKAALAALLSAVSPKDYIAINAYLQETDATHAALQSIRTLLGERANVATTLGYGPAYLHSSGQLQKGGSNKILVVILSYEAETDLPIPGKAFTFGKLAVAQAMGDFQSLVSYQHPVVRIHFSTDIGKGLQRLSEAL
jgi:transaldolase/glucose-6-phosphate isomerase